MNTKVWRLVGYVCTFAFVYMTIEIIRADPERRLLVLWILAGVAVVATSFMVNRKMRTEERYRHPDDDASIVSLVERIRRDR